MEVYINDTLEPTLTDSISIEDSIEQRATASFVVRDIQNTKSFKKGNPVRIEHNGNLLFRGFVEISRKQPISDTGQYIHQIDCTDMHYLADKRIAALAEVNTSAGSVVGSIINRYLREEGVENVLKYWADYENVKWEEL